ncbi:hypothetical protein TNCV_4173831 [Trichonephila clavipes]|nr:hypothetical protein TNCV_4173831 [Trichonephila clavipes]
MVITKNNTILPLCQLAYSLKFPIFRRICTAIIFGHLNYPYHDLIKTESRTKRDSRRVRPWARAQFAHALRRPCPNFFWLMRPSAPYCVLTSKRPTNHCLFNTSRLYRISAPSAAPPVLTSKNEKGLFPRLLKLLRCDIMLDGDLSDFHPNPLGKPLGPEWRYFISNHLKKKPRYAD